MLKYVQPLNLISDHFKEINWPVISNQLYTNGSILAIYFAARFAVEYLPSLTAAEPILILLENIGACNDTLNAESSQVYNGIIPMRLDNKQQNRTETAASYIHNIKVDQKKQKRSKVNLKKKKQVK